MARDERFKKYQDAGADFLETARARAEEFLRELAKATDSTQKQGRDTIDDLREGSRKGTEQFIASVRKEVTSQLSALGIATKADLDALERKLSGRAGSQKAAPAKKATAAKKSPTATKSTAKKSTAKKSTTRKVSAAKKTTSQG
jgi:polyhydroxyalkanoate synthesis regulator phasin